ncbi:MAG: hypothetical protein HYS24_03505 [Ignavibacteriales bacterium]|nr:hypothetical protein [Ignavibacteriales bacterium]
MELYTGIPQLDEILDKVKDIFEEYFIEICSTIKKNYPDVHDNLQYHKMLLKEKSVEETYNDLLHWYKIYRGNKLANYANELINLNGNIKFSEEIVKDIDINELTKLKSEISHNIKEIVLENLNKHLNERILFRKQEWDNIHEYMELNRKKNELQDIVDSIEKKSNSNTNKSNRRKIKTVEELIDKISNLPDAKRNSKNKIAKALGYAGASSLNNLIKDSKWQINIEDYIK